MTAERPVRRWLAKRLALAGLLTISTANVVLATCGGTCGSTCSKNCTDDAKCQDCCTGSTSTIGCCTKSGCVGTDLTNCGSACYLVCLSSC